MIYAFATHWLNGAEQVPVFQQSLPVVTPRPSSGHSADLWRFQLQSLVHFQRVPANSLVRDIRSRHSPQGKRLEIGRQGLDSSDGRVRANA